MKVATGGAIVLTHAASQLASYSTMEYTGAR